MSDITPINTSAPRQAGRVSVGPLTDPRVVDSSTDQIPGRGGARTNDRVEFSRVAQYLGQLQSQPTSSNELVDRIKTQIEAGIYLTDEKLSAAADELLDDLDL